MSGAGERLVMEARLRAQDQTLRGWLSPKAWTRWFKTLGRKVEKLDMDDATYGEQCEAELLRLCSIVACESTKRWRTSRISYKEARLGSWVQALQEHVTRCQAFEGENGTTSDNDPLLQQVRSMLRVAKRNLERERKRRLFAIAKKRLLRTKMPEPKAPKEEPKEAPKEPPEEPDEAAESPKEEEEFELDPNTAEELKRWGEFKTGPGATSDQKGIDELTAFVAKRQAETEAAANKSSDTNRSYHNEQMLGGPIPTEANVGPDRPAE